MSKSYNNTIELFSDEETLRKQINRIVTDSSLPNQPKSTDCNIFKIYQLFANDKQIERMKKRFAEGISWGEVKKETFEIANAYISPMRKKYNYYINNPLEVERMLTNGAKKARAMAKKTLIKVRELIGK
jgi:tryptophanyl-tRNA synthetase